MQACHSKEQENKRNEFGVYRWVLVIERSVDDAIWVTSRYTGGEILFFPWLLEGVVQIESRESPKV